MPNVQRALLSVTNKTGIVDFARALAGMGVELVSTGGTARVLREAGLEVRDISDLTGFPEMLDGRVKTLHPKVHGGILAMRANPEHRAALAEHGIETIDMVVINLYEFEKVAGRFGAPVSELIENIDIGGPSMIRSAAKNYQDVAVVVSPGDYGMILEALRAHGGDLPLAVRWELARKAFRLTAAYDAAITARLARIEVAGGEFRDAEPPALPVSLDLHVPRLAVLRYGENPHQSAACYAAGGKGIAGSELLHGKELSYNNLVDLDAAWQLILEFEQPASAIIKHTNPCGCAEQATLEESYRAAFAADPVSAFGGVLAFNRPVNLETAEEIAKTFVEAIAAPDYEPAALERLTKKKNLRLLRVSQPELDPWVLKSIGGGYLLQSADHHVLLRADARVASERTPTEQEWKALEFGWKVAKHVKSNAIVYSRAGQIVGVGAGQMSRVDSVKIGAMKAVLPLEGTVVASDAFFPFPDGVEEAARHGITAVIQPGGSVRDEEVVAAANRLGLAMVFTGVRHFRH